MCVIDVQPAVGNEDSCDEGWLVAKAKSGHEGAFGELYKRHQPRTYRTALRILRNQQDAEDAVQMAFQRALVKRHLHRIFRDRKSTRLNSSHQIISYAVFCLKKKKK